MNLIEIETSPSQFVLEDIVPKLSCIAVAWHLLSKCTLQELLDSLVGAFQKLLDGHVCPNTAHVVFSRLKLGLTARAVH
jgi:hypothetical protein